MFKNISACFNDSVDRKQFLMVIVENQNKIYNLIKSYCDIFSIIKYQSTDLITAINAHYKTQVQKIFPNYFIAPAFFNNTARLFISIYTNDDIGNWIGDIRIGINN